MIHFRLTTRHEGQWTLELNSADGGWVPMRHFSNKAEAERVLRAFVALGELAESCDD